MIWHFFLGFVVKIMTSFDDTITHIPVIASVTKTRIGKIAFMAGNFLAIIGAIVVALFFSAILRHVPFYRYIAAGVVFLLALLIYLDVFVHEPRTKAERKLARMRGISAKRFTKLLGIGFVASFATVIDDIVAYTPLFLEDGLARVLAIAGILCATILEILLVIYFSEKIAKIKYKEEIASAGLVMLGILILTGLV